jgi:hypothetical protein
LNIGAALLIGHNSQLNNDRLIIELNKKIVPKTFEFSNLAIDAPAAGIRRGNDTTAL